MRTNVAIQFYAQLTSNNTNAGTKEREWNKMYEYTALLSIAFIQYQSNFQFAKKM